MRLMATQEIEALTRQFGQPFRENHGIQVRQHTYDAWMRKIHTGPMSCRGEVIMAIERPNGRILLHTKHFYPEGIYRLPSGRVLWHEKVEQALRHEVHEETNLQVSIERFLGLIQYEFRYKPSSLRFVSYVFHLRELGGELCCRDHQEGITDFQEASLEDLSQVAARLEGLEDQWHDWGNFRAIGHHFVRGMLGSSSAASSVQVHRSS
jgi:ADP-ribose pyrophosphatase YjhB (NUDIX family)